jgi:hypothetical protein
MPEGADARCWCGRPSACTRHSAPLLWTAPVETGAQTGSLPHHASRASPLGVNGFPVMERSARVRVKGARTTVHRRWETGLVKKGRAPLRVERGWYAVAHSEPPELFCVLDSANRPTASEGCRCRPKTRRTWKGCGRNDGRVAETLADSHKRAGPSRVIGVGSGPDPRPIGTT